MFHRIKLILIPLGLFLFLVPVMGIGQPKLDEEGKKVLQKIQELTVELFLSDNQSEIMEKMIQTADDYYRKNPSKKSEPIFYYIIAQELEDYDKSKSTDLYHKVKELGNADWKSHAEIALRKMNLMGNPVPIKFTAIDGRKIDLTDMKGKVILVDFWATWCGPCVAEIPNIKKVYDKYHSKGFEIIGISFDNDRTKLDNFIKEHKMNWPQYFDGKGWENKFGTEYGISGIPTMWLIDKKGNLVDMKARQGLEQKVAKLSAE